MGSVSKTYRFRRARVIIDDEAGRTIAVRLGDGTATIRIGDEADVPLRIEVGGTIIEAGGTIGAARSPEG
jgi:ferric-dicitrate binding protein FerR (iron transport regulator)